MSMQAQIREWVDDALRALAGPLIERLEDLEQRLKALEQGGSAKSAKQPSQSSPVPSSSSHDRPVRAQTATGRGAASNTKPSSGK